MYTIALDDGHGIETLGKRTPLLPDGTFMHENEFNNAVVQLIKMKLQNQKDIFKPLLTALGDVDVSLDERVNVADNAKANIFVSVHANAMTDEFTEHSGIETFHYPGSVNGKRLAEIIHNNLIKGTPLKDRGIKTAGFYVLKYTNMPAVLVECAFMTNLKEARLLLSGAYREECATEIYNGICEYFNVIPIVDEYKKELKDQIITLDKIIFGLRSKLEAIKKITEGE